MVNENCSELPADNQIFEIFTPLTRTQSSQDVPAYIRIFISLFPMNAPIFKEQESAALPTELTTQNLTNGL